MKLLHTADWHIGRTLYGCKRYKECSAFLDWLAATIENESIHTLLMAGDVFDTTTPSNYAQELYYRFLCRVANSCCHHIVIIAGNHDSPAFLDAPRELLRALHVHIVGAVTDNLKDEVIVLKDALGMPEAIVCAVPYLRDKDIRTVEAGETYEDKGRKLIEGIRSHYTAVCAIAEQQRTAYGDIPLIAMGHLFTAGGKTVEGDGVRDLYVGSLAHVAHDIFPPCIDYLALGHLHVPQTLAGTTHMRYSGAPIPMGYGEVTQTKQVVSVAFDGRTPHIQTLTIPRFQDLERISGNMKEIDARISTLISEDSTAWLEVEYTGNEIIGNLRNTIDEMIDGSRMEIRRVKNKPVLEHVLNKIDEDEVLDNLNEHDVFIRLLDADDVDTEIRPSLVQSYNEITRSIHEEDSDVDST